ncbi:hypothetical protein J2S21_004338 [Peribacillus cavernae]|nr:hypothetical protein [Peribacillus cavernae]
MLTPNLTCVILLKTTTVIFEWVINEKMHIRLCEEEGWHHSNKERGRQTEEHTSKVNKTSPNNG